VAQNDERLAQFCKVDPRVVDGAGNRLFDIADAYNQAGTKAALVLPTGETTCIITAEFFTTGATSGGAPLVKAVYHLYNEGDGFRIIK
jgi:hypothetical protein